MTTETSDTHPARWRMLALLAIAELLGMSLWFAASAVGTQLAPQFGAAPDQVVWLTPVVQLGFVFGTATAALLNLADVIPSRRFFAIAACAGAVVNIALLATTNFGVALLLRFL